MIRWKKFKNRKIISLSAVEIIIKNFFNKKDYKSFRFNKGKSIKDMFERRDTSHDDPLRPKYVFNRIVTINDMSDNSADLPAKRYSSEIVEAARILRSVHQKPTIITIKRYEPELVDKDNDDKKNEDL